MLPDKRNLRKCLESYREPPKAVLSYYRSADGKCVYALLYYSEKRLERATFINRDFESIDVVPHTPVKWYHRLCFMQHEFKAVLLNAGPFYSYFRERNRNMSPFRFLENEITGKKEADSLNKYIANIERKNKASSRSLYGMRKGFSYRRGSEIQAPARLSELRQRADNVYRKNPSDVFGGIRRPLYRP